MPLKGIKHHLLHFLLVFVPMFGIQMKKHVNSLRKSPQLMKIEMKVDPRYQKVNLKNLK